MEEASVLISGHLMRIQLMIILELQIPEILCLVLHAHTGPYLHFILNPVTAGDPSAGYAAQK